MKLETSNSVSGRRLELPFRDETVSDWSAHLKAVAESHKCSRHKLFATLDVCQPEPARIAGLLRNYDAHAGVLRRLLLKAAAIMPEKACGYILENVRNEYGNGNPAHRHELQLLDLAGKSGVSEEQFRRQAITGGVRSFIRQVVPAYNPPAKGLPPGLRRPAIAAGAITATELLAIKEFVHMQHLFERAGLGNHIWFNHIDVEVEHSDESLALALYFIEQEGAGQSVLYGMNAVLDANVNLYDGLLESLS